MHQINWDHCRYLLTLSREGSIAAAARKLNVNRSTVLRRINSLQDDLQCKLYVRSDSGYSLTAEAEQIIAVAKETELSLFGIQRKIVGRELKLEGDLHITTTDSFMVGFLGPFLNDFMTLHPNILIHMHVTNHVYDLGRRDADIAIRPTMAPPDHLIGKKIETINFNIYATDKYLAMAKTDDWKKLRWVGFDRNFQASSPVKWTDEHIKSSQIFMRCDSFVAIKVAAENHIGVALLPQYLGDSSINLKCIASPKLDAEVGLWILTHPDLIKSAKVSAFYHFFKTKMTNEIKG